MAQVSRRNLLTLQVISFVSIIITCFLLISKEYDLGGLSIRTECKLLLQNDEIRETKTPEEDSASSAQRRDLKDKDTVAKVENPTVNKLNKTSNEQNDTKLRLADDRTIFDSPEFKKYIQLREERVNAHDFKFLLTGQNICPRGGSPILIIMCLSEYFHVEERETIRNTYGTVVNTHTWPGIPGKMDVKLAFIFGSPENSVAKYTIAMEEDKKFGDVVMVDFKDSYYNLTRKVMMSLKWVSTYCPEARFMLKADEDTFVHVGNLVTYLRKVTVPDNGVVIGHGVYRSEVLRTGRWAVNMSTYPFKEYPPYSSGNTYIISGNIVSRLFSAAEHLPYVFIEDGFITGITREAIGAEHVHKVGFTWWEERAPRLCGFHNKVRISTTNCDTELMKKLWKAIHQKLQNCYDPSRFEKPVYV